MIRHRLPAAVVFAVLSVASGATPQDTVAKFFSGVDINSATLSPAGDYVATVRTQDDARRLTLISTDDGSETVLLDISQTAENDALVRSVDWIDNEHIAIQYAEERSGIERLADTKWTRYLAIVELPQTADTQPRLLRVRTKGWLIDALPTEDNVFLYSKSGAYSRIYKINVSGLTEANKPLGKLDKVDGGQFVSKNQLASVEGYALRWFVDAQGQPAATLAVNRAGNIELSDIDPAGELDSVYEWNPKADENENEDDNELASLNSLIPIFKVGDTNSYYCVSYDDDTNALYVVDFDTEQRSLIYENDTHEIDNLIIAPSRDAILGVRVLRRGGLENVYFDQPGAEGSVEQSIQATIDTAADGQRILEYRESHNRAGHFVVVNTSTGSERAIGATIAQLDAALDSRQIEGQVTVEGLDIPYLLTLPDQTAPLPMIVMPHGGPIGVYDDRYFDLITQFLAASGYAVLRVNFRGSSGYSAELKEAGTQQWGGLILADIHAATLAVAQRDDIDAARIGIYGASYGGYAAMMLTIQHPDTYQCAASLAGVSDINLQIETPYASSAQREWLKEHVGDSTTQYSALKAQSPAYSAAQLQRPLLIAHGTDDRVVDIEHAHRMRIALEKFDRDHEFVLFDDQGHDLGDTQTRQAFFSQLTVFMNTHLGRN